jgi:hypothetical protein
MCRLYKFVMYIVEMFNKKNTQFVYTLVAIEQLSIAEDLRE